MSYCRVSYHVMSFVMLCAGVFAEMNLKATEAAEKAVAAKVDMEKAAAAAIASAHRSWDIDRVNACSVNVSTS